MKKYLILIAVLFTTLSNAQPGIIDSTFGTNGIVLTNSSVSISHGESIAVQPDGNIVVGGYRENGPNLDIYVARYYPSGMRDTAFGSNGEVSFNFTNSINYGRSLEIQPDGKIIIAGDVDGTLSSDFALLRINDNGTIDTTFGSNGFVTTDFGSNSGDQTHAMLLQPDGKIVITGWSYVNDKDIVLLRYESDGNLDSTFGINGKTATDISSNDQEANGITMQPDGKIIVTGFTYNSGTANDVVTLRYTANGILDSTFSGDGIDIPGINSEDDEGNAIQVQQDGKILVSGYSYDNTTYYDNLLMRYDSSGNLDNNFNGTGIVLSDIGGFDNWSNALMIQTDGKIITAGRGYSTSYDLAISRFLSNGELDTVFGTTGHTITDILNDNDEGLAIAEQADGKILVSGYAANANFTDNLMIVRYLNDSSMTTGITTLNSIKNIKVYPNPATQFLQVSVSPNVTGDNLSIEIYNQTGQLINSIPYIKPGSIEIDVKEIPLGLYLLQLLSDKGIIACQKFIKN